jgi:hypothetical protein
MPTEEKFETFHQSIVDEKCFESDKILNWSNSEIPPFFLSRCRWMVGIEPVTSRSKVWSSVNCATIFGQYFLGFNWNKNWTTWSNYEADSNFACLLNGIFSLFNSHSGNRQAHNPWANFWLSLWIPRRN